MPFEYIDDDKFDAYFKTLSRRYYHAPPLEYPRERHYQAPPPNPQEIRPDGTPPMPEGFTDRTAWDAIHWKFSGIDHDGNSSLLDQAVIGWQRDNQERCDAAARAEENQRRGNSE